MKLINTEELTISEFEGDGLPEYVILSHRWAGTEDEVSYVDFVKRLARDPPGWKEGTSGWRKIVKFCELARNEGYSWAWVDTCCINKRYSGELEEAIRSMFNWYRDAGVCYAYLHDITGDGWLDSEWWTRGWTLQELIAPSNVMFYDRDWTRIGSKKDENWAALIESRFSIPQHISENTTPNSFMQCSIARRMSWAAGRRTRQVEDRAYSLLGIFNISMPLLYGEGNRAFERLQLLIIEKYPDMSIFAW
ncbi:hypothetical protein K431DRAFT_243099, partial [Polychaeton citri CBS 116435]